METEKLAVWGFYDGALTMIFDILESQKYDSEILVINESLLRPDRPIHNARMKYVVVDKISDDFIGNYIICAMTMKQKREYISKNVSISKIISLTHGFSSISSTTLMGYGCVVNAGVVIAAHSSIGNCVFINRNTSIGHHTSVGNFTTINPGCNIGGNVSIGQDCFIGIGTTISNSLKIGQNTIIGAGSVVMKSVPDNVVAYGNPCKIIRKK